MAEDMHDESGDEMEDVRVQIGQGKTISLKWLWRGFWLLVLLLAVLFSPFWVWYWWRIEPGANEIAVLIRKTGRNLPSGQIVAMSEGEKGVQLEPLKSGRYFYNPYTWDWIYAPITDIPAGKLGVVTRLYGQDAKPGEILVGENTKGIVREILGPGKHVINPLAYSVHLYDATTVRPGCVGVKVSLVGIDPFQSEVALDGQNQLTVPVGIKGVVTEVLDPGSYYLNPYEFTVVEVSLQSQRFEMAGEDAINFLTQDGFTVHVEGTIEWAVKREMAAELTHRVGDLEDILKKLILPRARGFSRIEGSKNPAINYIVGETRQKFQDNLQTHLQEESAMWGVLIKSVLIRNITAPEEIASVIREREVAVQDARKFQQQIEQARSQAQLTRQEMLAVQNREKVQSETMRLRAVILAEQDQAVKVLSANKELEVAKLENDAATAQAQAIRLTAQAQQQVIAATNHAEAKVISDQVQAFGTGLNLARHEFLIKIAPRIGTILSNDDASGLGGLFRSYMPGNVNMPKPVEATEGQR